MATQTVTPEVMDTKLGQSIEDQPLDQLALPTIPQQQLPPRSGATDSSVSLQKPPEGLAVKEPYSELLQMYGRGVHPKVRTEEDLHMNVK